MRLVVLRCGTDIAVPPSTQLIDVKAVPTRQELKALDSLAAEVLPEDPTPSLAEIAAQPDVAHLGAPQYAPQPISDPLRVVVVGSDAALSAVLTRLMRADTMWVEVGFVPTDDDSPTADYWGITNLSVEEQFDCAASGRVRPLPLIRDDAATAVAGLRFRIGRIGSSPPKSLLMMMFWLVTNQADGFPAPGFLGPGCNHWWMRPGWPGLCWTPQ